MSAIVGSDPERDFATFLVSVPEQLAFATDDPATIVDRYYAPDLEWDNDGFRLDRDKLVQHAGPARKNVVGLRIEVQDVLLSGDRFAARYTMHAQMRKGATVVSEVYMHGRFAADGRIRQMTSITRTVPQGR